MDEIVTWPNLGAFTFLLSLLRPTHPQATPHLRALTNPFGAASEDLRDYFKTPVPMESMSGRYSATRKTR